MACMGENRHAYRVMRTAILWVIKQRVVVISYRRFGTNFRPHIQESRIPNPIEFLTPEYRIDRLYRNVSKKLLLYYIKNQQDATLAVLFISNCKITLHVSDAFCLHHQEYLKLQQQPLVHVMGRDDIYPVRTSKVGCPVHIVQQATGVAATTAFSTPVDGRRKRPTHVE